ncbi:MAG: hypothetical protein AABP62_21190 [Planctomycetota bacterium]
MTQQKRDPFFQVLENRLCPFLFERGYKLIGTEFCSSSFGNCLAYFEKSAWIIRIVRDRDQHFIEFCSSVDCDICVDLSRVIDYASDSPLKVSMQFDLEVLTTLLIEWLEKIEVLLSEQGVSGLADNVWAFVSQHAPLY